MTRDDLIKQLEQAQGPDRELDRAIHDLIYTPDWNKTDFGPVAYYTTSIDAALTLVPPHHLWQLKQGIQCTAIVWMLETDYDEGGHDVPTGYSTTFPAIALCIAALRARAAIKPYSDIDRLKEKGMRFVEE